MRLAILWIILRKELVEALRDRKTIFRMVVLPVLIYPLLVIGLTKFQGADSEAREARSSKIALWGEPTPALLEALGAAGKMGVEPWAGAPPEVKADLEAGKLTAPLEEHDETDGEGRRKHREEDKIEPPVDAVKEAARLAIESRSADAVLVLWPGFAKSVERDDRGTASIYFDSVRADSAKARERLGDALSAHRRKLVEKRLSAHALPDGFATAISVKSKNVAPPRREVGQILGGVMPFLLVGMSLLGALYPAIDLTAGEKERGTMQTLLCAPIRPLEIILGKFMAVWISSLLMALANLVSLSATLARVIPGELHVPPSVYVLTLVMLAPVTFLVSAVFLSLAVFAKDFKDAQNLLTPVFLPIYMVTGVSMVPSIELDAWTSLVPVVNIALLIKAAFLGDMRIDLAFLAIGSAALYAALALVGAARVFEREQILLGSGGSLRQLFSFQRVKGARPTPGFALAAASGIFVLMFYAGLSLARFSKMVALLGTQLGLMLLPTLALAFAFGFPVRETFAFKLPKLRAFPGAILLGLTSSTVVVGLLVRLIPVPEQFTKQLGDSLLLDGQPLWVLLLCLAVCPAICEELLFRGLVFDGLRKLGPWGAVFVSSLLFAVAHASIYRLAPTFALGMVMGYARLKSGSIVPGMLIHAISNGLVIALLKTRPAWATGLLDDNVPLLIIGGAAVAWLAGLALLRSLRTPALDR